MKISIVNRDTIITIVSKLFIMIAGIVTSIVTARGLGPVGRGELIALTTLGLTVANFSYMGFPSSNTYFIAKDESLIEKAFSNCLYISLFGSLITFLCALYFLDNRDPDYIINSIILFFFTGTTMLSCFTSNILISINRVNKYNLIELTQSFFILSLYLIFYLFKFSIFYFLLSALFASSLGAVLGISFLKNYISLNSIRFDFRLFKKFFKYAFKVYITTFIAFLFARGNIIFLQKYQSLKEIGFFSIALQIYEAISIVPAAIGLILFPRLIQSKIEDRKHKMDLILKQVAILMSFICIPSYFILPYIIPKVFGDSFESSIIIAQALLPGAFFLGLMSVVSQHLASIGYPKLQVLIWIFVFIIWVMVSNYSIPIYGVLASALLTSFVNLLLFILLYLLSFKKAYESL